MVLTLGYSVEHGGGDGFVDDLYLIPSARGSGAGAAVLDFALEQARLLGKSLTGEIPAYLPLSVR